MVCEKIPDRPDLGELSEYADLPGAALGCRGLLDENVIKHPAFTGIRSGKEACPVPVFGLETYRGRERIKMPLKINATENSFRQEVEQACGVDLDLCYECGKCSGGCSTGHHFDFTPRKIIQMIRLGDAGAVKKLLRMDALSICVSCRLCLERCPSGIDAPKIIDYLRETARRRNVPPKRPDVELFNRLFLDEIARRGRVSELSLIARFKIRTGNLWSDFGTGIRLLLRGKFNPFAPGVRRRDQVRKGLKGQ